MFPGQANSLRTLSALLESLYVFAVVASMLCEECLGQCHDVVAAISQPRQMDLDSVQPEQQIFPKTPLGGFPGQVGIGRGKDADVRALRFGRTDALELPSLEHSEKLALPIQWNARNLVEKKGTAVRELEAAEPIALRVGASIPHVAEELALEDSLGETVEVHRDHGARGSMRNGVKRPGDDTLAGTILPREEYVRI